MIIGRLFHDSQGSSRKSTKLVRLLNNTIRSVPSALLCVALSFSASCAVAEPRHFLVLDENYQPLANAAIELDITASQNTNVASKHVIAQVNKQFQPSVISIQAGESVSFPNMDKIRHHVYSFSPAKTFELKLYSGVPEAPVKFDQPGIVVLGCNIHDSMIGYMYVAKSSRHGLTDSQGRLTLDVPKGTESLYLWHSSFSLDGQKRKHYLLNELGENSTVNPPEIVIKTEN